MAAGTKVQLRLGDCVVAELTLHDRELRIGEHVLTISSEVEADAPRSDSGESEAWDAARAYFEPERAPRSRATARADIGEMLLDEAGEGDLALLAERAPAPAASAAPLEIGPRALSRPATWLSLPDPEGRFALGEEEVFDFAVSQDLGISEPPVARSPGRGTQPPAPAGQAGEPRYAGLIVERAGKVERVAPFYGAELIAGRGSACDLLLSSAGVSRQHARFVHEAGDVGVFDLGSANGVRVNGERVTERVLKPGDVVAIDEYSLTFVLDREPLDQAIRSATAAPPAAGAELPTALRSASFQSIPERDLVTDPEDEEDFWDMEKELEMGASDLAVEVVLGNEELPPTLRAAMHELGAPELRLPAELRIRRR